MFTTKGKLGKLFVTGIVAFGLLGGGMTVSADTTEDKVIDEKWGKPVYVYGGTLTDNEVTSLAKELGYEMGDLDAMDVTGEDMVRLLGDGNSDSNMYSSAVIERKDKGFGIEVKIDKPEYITKISEDQYTNAMITAGVEDAYVVVASPKKVTGESALTGIYKAYEEKGEDLDKDRMEVAQMELETTADIANELQEEDKSKLDDALIEIKQQLADLKEGQLTEEQVAKIVNDALDKRGLDELISKEDIDRLVELGYKYGQTGAINSEAVKQQLKDLSSQVGEKLGDLKDYMDESGWTDKIVTFFKDIFSAIAGLFK